MKIFLIIVSLLILNGCGSDYRYDVRKQIPDSLKEKSRMYVKELTENKGQSTLEDYKHLGDAIEQAEKTAFNIYSADVEGLVYSKRSVYFFIPFNKLDSNQKIIFQKFKSEME